MPKNLEIKVKLSSHKEVKSILKKNKIHFRELLIQKDIYYKVDKGILKLRIEDDKQTLIFYDRNEKSKKRWSDYHLLGINKTDGNEYLKRFLDVLTIVDKKRELYLYNNSRIHLDYVKNLGYFIELETIVLNGLKDAEKRFNYLLDLLNLRDKKEIRASYKDLLLDKTKK
ncbi:MAG: class IV adenylate cyclase [Ignavibacteria bacterium]|nr:class IV adenylate cyclase [Ignavibacteria bacterium]